MKISILTPNYNGARWLARGMDSVLSQQLAPGDELEYIVVDGGSTDGSQAIAEARRARLAALFGDASQVMPVEPDDYGVFRSVMDQSGWNMAFLE